MESGVGEATTLSGVLRGLQSEVSSFGFDLSWSRVAYAKRWLHSQGVFDTTLCTGNLLHIPFADNSIDVVHTSHSIEPNGGNEEPILQELFRVTRRFLILLEPGYELADDEAKRRMDSHGYCKNLKGIAQSLGYDVLEHRLFCFYFKPAQSDCNNNNQEERRRRAPVVHSCVPQVQNTAGGDWEHALQSGSIGGLSDSRRYSLFED
ncbi:MAG: methyltransferase domain-containing protein [Chthonomonadales bacterium]